mmetsp:Transcript_30461/g.84009  ORF Transcript_30461/g.84009 Transcript_30461/m.84009 type:complete len:332 (-) Transcript_30461:104-1099(-)|eukprot:CAMPEP_0179075206 /NCGR_PEP_ID=MMETSP0796-20121207/33476_1 /TAXON_ID=73915 /ORGANISM="Pyrodinium bahamense, Strain pbaha01" /LENGTH=331 /DNA_ID=CAMNT_0020772441 /DNA_START=78 /DNA_END=1073 /DNA_ORIENTATION=-
MAKNCALIWSLIVPLALVQGSIDKQADELARALLAAGGDECHASGSDAGHCAVNALQRSGHKVASVDALLDTHSGTGSASGDDSSEGTSYTDIPPSEPDLGAYANVTLEELGLDELSQLIKVATKVLDDRRAPSPHASSREESKEATSLSASATAAGCPYRPYTGAKRGNDLCFCQLSRNAGCKNDRCACAQGCNSQAVTWSNGATITFKNRARAQGCGPSTVLLTAPQSYFRDTSDLRRSCGGGAASLLAVMLKNSWDWYQSKVGRGPVNQCFHNPHVASVKYLHMQTFCAHGSFHAMPTGNRKNGIGFCVTMSSRDQAESLSHRLASWL